MKKPATPIKNKSENDTDYNIRYDKFIARYDRYCSRAGRYPDESTQNALTRYCDHFTVRELAGDRQAFAAWIEGQVEDSPTGATRGKQENLRDRPL